MSHLSLEALLGICKSGDAVADFELANRHLTGRGVQKSRPKAFSLYLKSSQDPHNHFFGFAHEALGDCHFYGIGTPVDERAAYKSYLKGANCAYPKSSFSAGVACLHGYGTTKDLLNAVKHFEDAAKHYHEDAEFQLGCILLEQGILHDRARGEEMITRAAFQGHAAAQERKARLISEGLIDESSSPSKLREIRCSTYAWLNLASARAPRFAKYRDMIADDDQDWLLKGQALSREIESQIERKTLYEYPKSPAELLGIKDGGI